MATNVEFSSRIAAASGDAGALLALAIELSNENARLSAEAATLQAISDERKKKQAERTRRHRNAPSRSVTLQGVTECDVVSPSPQVSSSFPTPHITPSFPPTPSNPQPTAPPPAAARGDLPARAARLPEYSADFEAAWKIFPTRSGSSSKKDAYSAWRARLRSGVSAELLHSGVARYRAYCEAKGIVGTEYVKQCSSFFGKGEHYANPWDAPAAKPKTIMVFKDGWYADVLV